MKNSKFFAKKELERNFTEEEIKLALWACGLDKSPGSDCFNFYFFQEFWDLVKEDFIAIFEEFFSNSKLLCGLNSSFITLIPKCENPQAIEDYRQISQI